jgi:hypothetical protein
VVKNSSCGSLYFGSYTPWKIGFVASPETSQKQVFRVKTCHNLFITDPNSVRPNVLVRVQYLVCFVIVSDQFNEYFVRATLYKVAL